MRFIKKHRVGLTVSLAVVLCMVMLISFFITTNLFNSQHFTQKTTQAITSDEARAIIAGEAVEVIFADRPIANRIVGAQTEDLINSLIGTNLFEKIISKVVSNISLAMTTGQDQSITLNFEPIVGGVNAFLSQVAPDRVISLEESQRSVTLLDTSAVPNLKTIGSAFTIMGPISALLLLVILIWSWIKSTVSGFRFVSYVGLVMLISSFLLLIKLYVVEELLKLNVGDPEMARLAQIVYETITSNFRSNLLLIFFVGLIIYLVCLAKLGSYNRFIARFKK